MSKVYQIEALLRPAVEFSTVLVTGVFMVFLYLAPTHIFMTPAVANMALILLSVLFLYRLWQGIRIVRYKKNLRSLPHYVMSNRDIPVSNKVLFIGKGFEWQQRHIQRLRDISLYGGRKFTRQSTVYRFIRNAELRFESNAFIGNLLSPLSIDHWLNPFRPVPDIGGIRKFMQSACMKAKRISILTLANAMVIPWY